MAVFWAFLHATRYSVFARLAIAHKKSGHCARFLNSFCFAYNIAPSVAMIASAQLLIILRKVWSFIYRAIHLLLLSDNHQNRASSFAALLLRVHLMATSGHQ
jgi:hypothetical protein